MKKLALLLAAVMVFALAVPAMAKTSQQDYNVTFSFSAPNASAVYLAGSFNAWNPSLDLMKKGADGVWTFTLELDPGTYQYKFVADGVWTTDMDAAAFTDDGFGGQNSVLVVRKPGEGGSGADSARLDALEAKIASIDTSFQYHGYARGGLTLGSQWLDAENGTGFLRLGHEKNFFVEQVFEKVMKAGDATMRIHFLMCHKDNTPNGADWIVSNGVDVEDAFREGFVEAKGLDFAPDLSFWVGRRYLWREDVHIMDWYWRNLSGSMGGGVEGIKIGDFAKYSVAYTQQSDGKGASRANRLHNKFTDIALGEGTLEVELSYGWDAMDTAGTEDGFAATAIYRLGNYAWLADGTSKFALHYGEDVLGSYKWYGPKSAADYNHEENDSFIALFDGIYQVNQNFEVNTVVFYEKCFNWSETWGIAARPVYHFSKNFALQGDLGYRNQPGDDNNVIMATVAPTITLDLGFWTRPQLRTFVSYVKPEADDAKYNAGFQFEAWW